MKLIIDEPKAVPLDESYCKRNSENSQSFIDDKFYENKQPGIFDDNFQGIEWPVIDDLTRFSTSLDITDLRNLLNPANPLNMKSMFEDDD